MDIKTDLTHITLHRLLGIVSLALMILLSSCAHVARKDGPPNFYVDASRIPDATPKVEPLSKYGNYRTYVVFGRRYHTMPTKTAKNYEAVGVASWYGTKFQKLRTSSGERYDMLGMTAAHKTLPLPTYVQVTNLNNGRKVIVKVNDRGPFEGNRLIDLSYVAAKKLGMAGRGTALVKIKTIDPNKFNYLQFAQNQQKKTAVDAVRTETETSSDKNPYQSFWITQNGQTESVQADQQRPLDPAHQPRPHWKPHYIHADASHYKKHLAKFLHAKNQQFVYLQVGAFRNKLHAQNLQKRLTGLFSTASVKIAQPSAAIKLYRVRIGPIKDVVTALKITHRLKELGIKSNKV